MMALETLNSFNVEMPMFVEHYSDEDLRIYHMTHIDNLASVLENGYLYSRNKVQALGVHTRYGAGKCVEDTRSVKLSAIDGHTLGDFALFFFAPRSAMLGSISRHPGGYAASEDDMIYLVADFKKVRNWADANGIRWEVSGRNCLSPTPGISVDNDFAEKDVSPSLPHPAIDTLYPQSANEDSEHMAEFHLLDGLPIDLIDEIVVKTPEKSDYVDRVLKSNGKGIAVRVDKDWYFK